MRLNACNCRNRISPKVSRSLPYFAFDLVQLPRLLPQRDVEDAAVSDAARLRPDISFQTNRE